MMAVPVVALRDRSVPAPFLLAGFAFFAVAHGFDGAGGFFGGGSFFAKATKD